jgi:hypothetical protein
MIATRPICPHCNRPAVFVNSHKSGALRVRGLGCKRCNEWSLGSDVEDEPTATVSKVIRDRSGRFAMTR